MVGQVDAPSEAQQRALLAIEPALHPYPLFDPPDHIPPTSVPVARFADLTAMKLQAISTRGAARDFWDLHAMISHRSISLTDALAEYQRRYPSDDLGHVVRSLAYFGDAEAAPLPAGLDRSRWQAIRRDIEAWVREL